MQQEMFIQTRKVVIVLQYHHLHPPPPHYHHDHHLPPPPPPYYHDELTILNVSVRRTITFPFLYMLILYFDFPRGTTMLMWWLKIFDSSSLSTMPVTQCMWDTCTRCTYLLDTCLEEPPMF